MTAPLWSRCIAETIGTAFLVAIGCGAIVAASGAGGVPQILLAVAWFLAVAIPILAFARISGAHLNPAVTLTLVGSGHFPAREAPPYMMGQMLGALGGSVLVLVLLGNAAHLGATLPAGGDLFRTLMLELFFTLALLLSVLYLGRPGAAPRPAELLLPPTVVGISTYLIGPFTGSSLNPARTIGPAIVSGDYLGLWVYLLAALVASAVAVLLARAPGRTLRGSPPGRASAPSGWKVLAKGRGPGAPRRQPPPVRST